MTSGSNLHTEPFRRVLAARYVIIGLAFASSALLSGGRGDWDYFVELGRQLVTEDRLSFYGVHGDAQTGALSLGLAALLSLLPSSGFWAEVVIAGAVGMTLTYLTEQLARDWGTEVGASRVEVGTLTSGVLLGIWWGQLGATGHLDDAMVLLLAVVALSQYLRKRPGAAGVAIGLAVAFKPWAVFFVPFALDVERPARRRSRQPGLLIAGAIGAAAWLPFIVAEPASLTRLSPTVLVADDATIRLIGLEALGVTSGLRIAQLLAGMFAVLGLTLLSRPHAGIVAAIAIRLLLDPGTWNYYTAGLVLGCIVWERVNHNPAIPWLALLASVGLLPESLVGSSVARSVMRTVALVAILAIVLTNSRRLAPRHEAHSVGHQPESNSS